MTLINFAINSYQSRSKPLNSQRLINAYLEPAPKDSKAPHVLFGTPGMNLFTTVGTGPIYGMHVMDGLLYVVSGNNVFTVTALGGTSDLGTIGSVADVVIMDDNGTQVMITKQDGSAYSATASTLVQITDPDFVDAASCTYLDGYMISNRTNSNVYVLSGLFDVTAYNALDFASAEESPDLLVRVFAHTGNLWLFGGESIEVHYNSGAGDFPFVPIQGAAMSKGCSAKRSVVQEDNTLFWFGNDRVVYRSDGYIPKRISTHAIEKAFQGYTTISDAEGFSYTQEGHKFYVLTFPTELQTWVYDISTGLWHERQSFEKERWRASSQAFIYDLNLVGDFESNKLYALDLDTYDENGAILKFQAVSPPIFAEMNPITHDRLWIDADTGVGLLSGQGSEPMVSLEYSDDGTNTWSSEKWRSMGKQGEFDKKVVWDSLGESEQRAYRVTITDPVKRHIKGAYADLTVGQA